MRHASDRTTRRFLALTRGARGAARTQEVHTKWNGTTWTQAHHLLGLLCLEPRRACFAAKLLSAMGLQGELEGCTVQLSQDGVDRLAAQRLKECMADGTLEPLVARLGLRGPGVVKELKLLATAAPRDTGVNPVLSLQETPRLYNKFIPLLFIGFAHNLRLESYVSVLRQLVRAHPKADSQLIDHMFVYRTNNQHEREARCDAKLRSTRGGGAREAARDEAAEGKTLKGTARNKKQLRLLQQQAEQRAARYAVLRRKRGEASVAGKRKRLREEFDETGRKLAKTKFDHLAGSSTVTAKGGKRRPALSATECVTLIPSVHSPGAKVKKGRGSLYKKGVSARKKVLRGKKKEAAVTKKRLGRTRPLNKRELRLVHDERPEGKQPSKAKSKAPKKAVASDSEEEDSEEEDESDEELEEMEEEGEEEEDMEEEEMEEEEMEEEPIIPKLSAERAELRARLNVLREWDPIRGKGLEFPRTKEGNREWAELLPRYQAVREKLKQLGAA